MKLTLIGSGNLGKQLYLEFLKHPSIELIQWMDRSATATTTPENIELINSIDGLKEADCYLLAVSDNSIEQLAVQLPKEALIVHTSGSTGLNFVSETRRSGVFYPLQTFSKDRAIEFLNLPICIEASHEKDFFFLELLAKRLHASPLRINTQQRKTLHLAAVLVNNFTNHLFAQAEQICKKNNLPFELLKPLMFETVNKLDSLDPKEAQTGPAIREDQKTIEAHLEIIESPQLEKLYNLLTDTIINYNKNEKL
ncbi:MAG: DUF2520 domain-containing protein [Flavobacteriaceae bacterium]|nr:DUF2520 domain-containing protein [Flavobacteriaceae bacterium]